MNCWFWVWFLHFSGRKSLRNLFQPAERGVVLSRNQIAAIGLPESWVNCLAEAAEPHWWQEFLPIKSPILLLFCPSDVKTCHAEEKCWNPTRETNGKGRKNPTPQDLSAWKKSHEPKRRPAFFPMAPGNFAGCLNWIWMYFKMFEFLLKKNGKWSCMKCHSATYVGLDSMDRWKISKIWVPSRISIVKHRSGFR